jgi:hypothetical protein
MYRRQLTPIFVLVLMIAAVELILSCGGGNNSNCGTYNTFGSFIPGPCATPVPPIGYHLTQINVCPGAPLIPTHTAKASVTPTGKATPTSTPTPCPTSTTVAVPNTLQFDAGGVLMKGKQVHYQDVTGISNWFSNNSNVFYNTNGEFTSVNPGCSCVYASSGGIVSGPMSISIAPAVGPFPECTPCATLTPTETPTAKPTTKAAAADASAAVSAIPIGVQNWQFGAGAAIAGDIAIARDGRSAFLTSNRRLIVLDRNGIESFARAAGGDRAQFSAGGTIYAEGPSGGLFAYNPDGSSQWDTPLAAGPGPLAIGADGVVYYADVNQLSAVDSGGEVRWNAAIPGVIQVVIENDVIVAATAGGITALGSDGAIVWSFAPEGGIAGSIAANASAVYVASNDGSIHALGLSDGAELWHAVMKGITGGVAVSPAGRLFVSADRLYTFSSNGTAGWESGPMTLNSVAPAAVGEGVIVAADSDHLAFFDRKGTLNWIAGNFGKIVSVDLSSSGLVFIGQSNGILSVLKVVEK